MKYSFCSCYIQRNFILLIFSNGKSKKKSNGNSKDNSVRPQYMESSTESEEEDDRKLEGIWVNKQLQEILD